MHRAQHPLEFRCFAAVLTLWAMGWVGLPPAVVPQPLALRPPCFAGIHAPELYTHWRAHMHRAARPRCDWLNL